MSLGYHINMGELVIIQNATAQESLMRRNTQNLEEGRCNAESTIAALHLCMYCSTKPAFRFPKLLFYY